VGVHSMDILYVHDLGMHDWGAWNVGIDRMGVICSVGLAGMGVILQH
jgi:hypothetical protein